MDDLISRKALVSAIENNHPQYNDGQDIADWQMQCIKNAPTVDARPVRHGEWIWNNDAIDFNIGAWVCSRCGGRNENIHAGCPGKNKGIGANPYIWAGAQYCPNCGARMDGDEHAAD